MGIDDLLNNIQNNVVDASDAVDAIIDAVNPIHTGARVIVSDTKSPYYGVIGDVIEITSAYDEKSEADMQVATVKVIRPMIVTSVPTTSGYPINSTDPSTQADMGSEIKVPADHLDILTTPDGSEVRNKRAGGIGGAPIA